MVVSAWHGRGLPTVLACLLFCGLVWATHAAAQKPQGEKWALLVGINQYKHWRNLRTPVRDIKAIKDLLLDKYGYRQDRVMVLLDKQATRKNIFKAFSDLKQKLSREDSLFIYYAGHGVVDPLEESLWVPHESDQNEYSQMVDTARLRRILDKLNVHRVFLVADSCFSGAMLSLDGEPITAGTSNKGVKSRLVLTSGGNEPVRDHGRDGHSAFAYHFIRVLDQNADSYLSATALSRSVKEALRRAGIRQKPRVSRNHVGEDGEFQFVLRDAEPLPDSPVSKVDAQGRALFAGEIETVRNQAIMDARMNALRKVINTDDLEYEGEPMIRFLKYNGNGMIIKEKVLDWNIVKQPGGESYYVVNLQATVKKLERPFFRPALLDANFEGGYESFRPGEEIKLRITAHADVYVIVANYQDRGDVAIIYPNSHQSDNFIAKGSSLELPNGAYRLMVKNLKGRKKIKEALLVYAIPKTSTTKEIYWSSLFHAGTRMQFAGFQKKLSEIRVNWLAKKALVYTIQ